MPIFSDRCRDRRLKASSFDFCVTTVSPASASEAARDMSAAHVARSCRLRCRCPCHGLSDTFRSHEPCRHRAGCKHCTLASANGSMPSLPRLLAISNSTRRTCSIRRSARRRWCHDRERALCMDCHRRARARANIHRLKVSEEVGCGG
jgi:hypothetical protein